MSKHIEESIEGNMPEKRVAQLNIQEMELAPILEHPDNPRHHPEPDSEEWNALKSSLEHDYFDPLVVNTRNNMLVSGHLRRKVMMDIGITHAQVVVVDYSESEHIARMIAANNNIGEFDYTTLTELMMNLPTGESDNADYTALTGYTPTEIQNIFAANDAAINEIDTEEEYEDEEETTTGEGNEGFRELTAENVETNCVCPRCKFEFNFKGKK